MSNNIKYGDISKTGNNLVNVDAVMESIKNILSTTKGERPFLREFGSNIEKFLFYPMSFSVTRLILSDVVSSINRWEPRVKIITKDTDVILDKDNRTYYLTLKFKINGLENILEYNQSLEAN